jgi:NADPH2:quinone reductase
MSATVPESMLAVVLEGPGGRVALRQCPVPRPGAGQVVVRMAASPINISDLASLMGIYKVEKPQEAIAGLEGSGVVVAAGSGLLSRLRLGKRVACTSMPSAGGSWAEYMVTSAKACIPLRADVTLEQGATMTINPFTALALFEIAERGKHHAIVISAAASALGRMILRLGQQNGVPVICVVRRKEQVDLIHALGGEYVLNSSEPDFCSQLHALTHRLEATLFLDAVAGSLTNQLLEAAPAGSTLVMYSFLSPEECVIKPRELVFAGKRMVGFYLTDWLAEKGPLQLLQTAAKVQRLLPTVLQTTIQRRLPLSSAPEAIDLYAKNMSAGKVLLVANPAEVPLDA